jgi:hypothetical protein
MISKLPCSVVTRPTFYENSGPPEMQANDEGYAGPEYTVHNQYPELHVAFTQTRHRLESSSPRAVLQHVSGVRSGTARQPYT